MYTVFNILIVVYSITVYNRDKTDAEISKHEQDLDRDDMVQIRLLLLTDKVAWIECCYRVFLNEMET